MSKYLNLVIRFTVAGTYTPIAVFGGAATQLMGEARAEMGEPNATDGEVEAWACEQALDALSKQRNVVAASYLDDSIVYIPETVYKNCIISCGRPSQFEMATRQANGLPL